MELERIRDAVVGALPGWLRRAGRTALRYKDRQNAIHEWRRSRRGPPDLTPPIRRVLVICYGNICRSPFAGELLAERVPALEVRSAGLEARDGKPAEPGANRVARRHDIDLAAHGAHRMCASDVEWADLIIAMEGYQCAEVRRRWPQGADKTHLLGDFFGNGPFLIMDPYGHGDDTFDEVFDRIVAGVDALASRLPPGDA